MCTPYLENHLPHYGQPLDPLDQKSLGVAASDGAAQLMSLRGNSTPTPLISVAGLAGELGLGSLHLKDEGYRLGIGSFKALGGAYALMVLVQEEAARHLGHAVVHTDLFSGAVREVAASMTFACATDGNHGLSVAQGAQLMGARAVIFVHAGVSAVRMDAISRFGAEVIEVRGTYDDSVGAAIRAAKEKDWILLSDTSWPGYENIPGLVMQGYTVMVRECLASLPKVPTHVFLQAGVGGLAAAVAGHLALVLGDSRPHITVVDPARAACLYQSAKVGRRVKVAKTEPTVMAMLECYEPSLIAFRILERVADGFMTVDEEAAPSAMRLLASPIAGDPAVVAGESGAVGLAGLMAVLRNPDLAARIGLGPESRILIINSEGATDAELYKQLVGISSVEVLAQNST